MEISKILNGIEINGITGPLDYNSDLGVYTLFDDETDKYHYYYFDYNDKLYHEIDDLEEYQKQND